MTSSGGVTVLIATACVLALADGFSFQSGTFLTTLQSTPKLRPQSSYRTAVVCELTKIEEKSVQRMTKQWDKLCKTCPTRLQPRVDTITEMLVNLEELERQEVFANVEQRLKEGELGGTVVSALATSKGTDGEESMSEDVATDKKMNMKEEEEKMKMSKMEKKRMKLEGKIEKNTMKLSDAKQRLEMVSTLDSAESKDNKKAMELKAMSTEELEIYRLKAMEKVYKYERKLAECKLKLKMLEEQPAMAKC